MESMTSSSPVGCNTTIFGNELGNAKKHALRRVIQLCTGRRLNKRPTAAQVLTIITDKLEY
eukprot:UN10463